MSKMFSASTGGASVTGAGVPLTSTSCTSSSSSASPAPVSLELSLLEQPTVSAARNATAASTNQGVARLV